MNFARNSKSVLLQSCGGVALALGAMALSAPAHAQAFQATPSVVQGSVTIDRAVPNVDTITVDGLDAVIDWTPDEINGSALTFLPNGNTAVFQSLPGATDFAVINRVLPSLNGDVTVMNGAVISQLQQLAGPPVPGGNVMFYSSTGLIIGSTATFDVGGLVLTSLAPDIATFGQFASSTGSTSFTGVTNDASFVQIDPGATITATEDGSYFAVVTPQVTMSGIADINGSTAYVAAQETTLSYADGLFDIVITTGTNVGTPIFHDGTTTGPASNGGTDNHVIYAVMQAQANPITALFTGDLGFAPAVSATIDNGEVVLVGNYDVLGLDVAGDTIGSGTFFSGRNETSNVQADIFVTDNSVITSNITAITTHTASMQVLSDGPIDVVGDVTLVGRTNAEIFATAGFAVNIDGDVLVSARNFGNVVGTVGTPGELDAIGGTALISANGGDITITGEAVVNARASSGVATIDLVGGTAQGGTAFAEAQNGATLDVGGSLRVLANASSFQLPGLNIAGDQTGGSAQIAAFDGGSVLVAGDAQAQAFGASVTTSGTAVTQVSNGIGGSAQILVDALNAPSLVDIAQNVLIDARGSAGSGGPVGGAGGDGVGGFAGLQVFNGGEALLGGIATLDATGSGGTHANGIGGTGVGGFALGEVSGNGNLVIDGALNVFSNGNGGDGEVGGAGYGGQARVSVVTGTLTTNNVATILAEGSGGDALLGLGGDGGFAQGGNASIQAAGTLTEDAVINIGGNLSLRSGAIGGAGGAGDGSTIAPGAGGDALGGEAATDVFAFPGTPSGAYAFANGDRGTLTIGGDLTLSSSGAGGPGGNAGAGQLGGTGGNGESGDAIVAVVPGAGDGSVALGSLTAGVTNINTNAFGGNGGRDASGTTITGIGGDATAGRALVQAQFGTLTLGDTFLSSRAFGGTGSTGGSAIGGFRAGVSVLNSDSGTIVLDFLSANADARGGTGTDGNGGDATGGAAFVGFQGGAVTILGNTILDASGIGGSATNGTGGSGTGGLADLADFSGTPGSGDFQGLAQLIASGIGGSALSAGFDGGAGTGGNAFLLSQPGSILNAADVTAAAAGIGGSSVDGTGGSAQGGLATADAIGTGAQLFAGSLQLFGGAIGGSSTSGTGGDAQGGSASASAEDSGSLTVDTQLGIVTATTAGSGATGGSAFGGESFAIASDNGAFTVGDLDINATADTNAASGGTIEGGTADLFVTGPASFTATSVTATATADGVSGGSATGGSATVGIESSGVTGTGQLDVGTLSFDVDAAGADTNAAGDFDIFALNGNATIQTLTGTAQGESFGDSISLEADGFNIAITGSASIDAVNDLEFITANGGLIIGGTSALDLTASFDFATDGLITIVGDNDNLESFGALDMTLISSDIDVLAGARFGAASLQLVSTNTAHAAVIGGTSGGLGYSLTQDEGARIEAGSISFEGPATLGGDPFDVEIQDVDIFGSLDDGVSAISVFSEGTLGVTGLVDYQFAGPGDQLQLGAASQITVLLDVVNGEPAGGALFMTDGNGDLAGTITMFAPTIVAVDSDILGQLADDFEFPGLADALAAEQGFAEPDAYIAADTVGLFGEDYIYTQNWGAGGIFSGVAVGPGGFTLQQDGDTLPNLLNAIVYGIQVNGVDDFTTNSDFFAIVEFNMEPANHFTTASTLNDCNIVNGACGLVVSENEEVVEAVTTATYTELPPEVTAQVTEVVEQSEADAEFGVDFPGLFNPPSVQDDSVVREPVTSGGDAANYAQNNSDEEEDGQDEL